MRLATKKQRLDLQAYQFNQLIEKGYKREDYNGLMIFKMIDSDSTWLKIFRGTASKEILYKRYRTEEQANQQIKWSKANADRRQAYKEELKANPTKSSASNCATAIREELKKNFPSVKFAVKSSNFAGGDSVHVSWTDGPTEKEIRNITSKYQYGSFNGMEDIYEYTNKRDDIPQTKYTQERRTISDSIQNIVVEKLTPMYSNEAEHEIQRMANRIIWNTSIPPGAIVTGIKSVKDCGLIEDVYTLDFDLSEVKTSTTAEKPNFEAVEVPEGQIQLIDYSEKSFAVIGETKPIKDDLKRLGGSFNFRLTCGAGWIFKKSDLEKVKEYLTQKAA